MESEGNVNILIIHNSLNDSTSVSGVLKHYAFMANAWIEKGHAVDFLVAKAGFPQLQRLSPQAGRVSSDGIFNATKYLSKTWAYFPAYGYRGLTCHYLRLPHRYDVVYASGQFILETYCARVIAKRQKTRWVAKIQHVLSSQPKRGGFINTLFLNAERLSAKWMHRFAAKVMCLSRVVADDYRALEEDLKLSPTTQTVQVGCGIDCQSILDGTKTEKKFDVVFLGRLHEQKGVFDLPEVWARVIAERPQATLLIIGEGPHRQAMQAKLAELGIADSVTVTGGISEEEKNLLLAQACVGLSLSYEEGWGLSVTEFLATGLPVVAYDLPVFRDIFPDQLESVPAGDKTAASEAILKLLRDPHLIEKGSKAREFAQRYDYRNIAGDELAELIEVAERK